MGICQCIITSPPPVPCNNGNCIYAPNMLVTNVTACAGVSTIDLSPIVTVCGTNTIYYSISKTSNVSNVSITEDSITFTPENNDYQEGIIKYRIKCGNQSKTGTIVIVYENNCLPITCDSGELCNKCTGLCEPLPPDLFTNSGDPDLFT